MAMDNLPYDDMKDVFKEPQEYKGINFYPLKIKDYFYINKMYMLFAFPKRAHSIKDPVLYKMSYLKFLLLIIGRGFDEGEIEKELISCLKYITKADNIKIDVYGDTRHLETFDFKIIIDGISFPANEFDNIRSIILKQNGTSVKYVEDYNENLEKSLRDYRKSLPLYNFKDRIFSFAALMGKTIDEIKDCTLYEMEKLLEASGNVLECKMQVVPLTHVSKEHKFISYMTHFEEEDRYSGIKVDVDKFKKDSVFFKSPEELAKKQIKNN